VSKEWGGSGELKKKGDARKTKDKEGLFVKYEIPQNCYN